MPALYVLLLVMPCIAECAYAVKSGFPSPRQGTRHQPEPDPDSDLLLAVEAGMKQLELNSSMARKPQPLIAVRAPPYQPPPPTATMQPVWPPPLPVTPVAVPPGPWSPTGSLGSPASPGTSSPASLGAPSPARLSASLRPGGGFAQDVGSPAAATQQHQQQFASTHPQRPTPYGAAGQLQQQQQQVQLAPYPNTAAGASLAADPPGHTVTTVEPDGVARARLAASLRAPQAQQQQLQQQLEASLRLAPPQWDAAGRPQAPMAQQGAAGGGGGGTVFTPSATLSGGWAGPAAVPTTAQGGSQPFTPMATLARGSGKVCG